MSFKIPKEAEQSKSGKEYQHTKAERNEEQGKTSNISFELLVSVCVCACIFVTGIFGLWGHIVFVIAPPLGLYTL